jgi:aspartate-semialdehyde dehydrogenase
VDLRLIAAGDEEAGTLTEQGGDPTFLGELDRESLSGACAVFLAGTAESSRRALELGAELLIDLTGLLEESPRARLRAPMVEPEGCQVPEDAVHVVASPAAIALALLLGRVHQAFPLRRAVVNVFEPASERGAAGLDELQRQTVNLLSFQSLPKKVFDAQVGFNLLARYGEEAPFALEDAELRVERHLATLLGISSQAPMPSIRLIQAPVFHGHSFSVWLEFDRNPGVQALEEALAGEPIDVRGAGLEPPDIVGMAGQSGLAVGALAVDRNQPNACWVWMVADNLRLAAENGIAVARRLL